MGMEDKMERIEYAIDPLQIEHSSHGNKDVLLTICENSQGSQDVAPINDDIQYEVRNADGVLQYRFVNASQHNQLSDNLNTEIEDMPATLQSANCQFYVISDLTTRPCLITPKAETESSPGCTRHLILNSNKKRDEKRRATHNEVERRRRDKINQWIFKLKDLLPENTEPKSKSTMGDSKGEILIKACEYIKSVQLQVESLKECLKENEVLRFEMNVLKEKNQKLLEEKERLLKSMERGEIKEESDSDYIS